MKPSPDDDRRSDQELVSAINNGDAAAFDTLYYRYRDAVMSLAQRMTGNSADALDVLQETWAYVIRKFPGFVLTARFSTFLFPVVRNLSIAARRKRERFRGDEARIEAAPAADSPAEGGLLEFLDELPEMQRQVLVLRFVHGLSLEEIAQTLEIPAGTVKSRIHNAIKALREDPRTREYFQEE